MSSRQLSNPHHIHPNLGALIVLCVPTFALVCPIAAKAAMLLRIAGPSTSILVAGPLFLVTMALAYLLIGALASSVGAVVRNTKRILRRAWRNTRSDRRGHRDLRNQHLQHQRRHLR